MKRRIALGAAAFMAAAFSVGGFVLLRPPQGPPEAEGRAWRRRRWSRNSMPSWAPPRSRETSTETT
ncbi:MAG: hypothetical protein ACRYF2_02410 [Janthinobacterium lividum]